MPTAIQVPPKVRMPLLNVVLQGMPERQPCRCGDGLPEVTFDFNRRTWFVWCGCGLSSSDMVYLDHAILDFNTKARL